MFDLEIRYKNLFMNAFMSSYLGLRQNSLANLWF
jgi:hypothetical protein